MGDGSGGDGGKEPPLSDAYSAFWMLSLDEVLPKEEPGPRIPVTRVYKGTAVRRQL